MQGLIWQALSVVFLAIALGLAIAALWPPLSLRRMALAACALSAAAAVAMVTFLPAIPLPTHLLIIAECKAIKQESAAFNRDLDPVIRAMPWLSQVVIVVLPGSGGPCDNVGPIAVAVPEQFDPSQQSDLEAALAYARAAIDSEPWYLAWRANSVVLVGSPGGSLSVGRRDSEGARKHYLYLSDKYQASISYHEVGLVPGRAFTVSAPVWRATPVARSTLALQLDFTDDRISEATAIDLEIREHSVDGSCRLPPEKEVERKHIELTQTLAAGPDVGEFSAYWPEGRTGRRLILLLGYWPQAADSIDLSTCQGSWWLVLEVEATVTLQGGTIPFSGAVMAARQPPALLTLYTPKPGSAGDRHASAGWERDAAGVLDPLAQARGLAAFIDQLNRTPTLLEGLQRDWPFNALWNSLGKNGHGQNCWFRGTDELEKRSSEFVKCIERSRRLAAIAPDRGDVRALDGFGIDDRVKRGELDALIAAPEFDDADANMGQWARVAFAGPRVVSLPLILASMSHNGLLVRDDKLPPALQEQIIAAMGATDISGDAEASESCARPSRGISGSGLIWLTDRSTLIPVQPPDRGCPATDPHCARPELRLRGVVRTALSAAAPLPTAFENQAGPRGRITDRFAENVQCDNPLKRAIDAIAELERTEVFASGAGRVPRATVVIFDVDRPPTVLASPRDLPKVCVGNEPSAYAPENVKKRLNRFLQAGGLIIVQPIGPASEYVDKRHYDIAIEKIGGAPSAQRLLADAAGGAHLGIITRPTINPDEAPATIAAGLLDAIQAQWNTPSKRAQLFSFRADDGVLSRRNAACAADRDGQNTPDGARCSYGGFGAPNRPYATALNRIEPAPEFFRTLSGGADDASLVSGRVALGDGALIRDVRQLGLGRSYALGYSPFARDQLAPNLFWDVRDDAYLNRGLCYLYDTGRRTFVYRESAIEAQGGIARGTGMIELERFAAGDRLPVGGPVLDSVTDYDPGSGAFTLVVFASLTESNDWHWRLKLTKANGDPYETSAVPASLIFQSYDPLTGEARIRVAPRSGQWNEAIAISFDDGPRVRFVLPAVFRKEVKGLDLATVIERFDAGRSVAARISFDGPALGAAAVTVLALLMFSPLARHWTALYEALLARRSRPGESMTPKPAPLFSLQAALTEWGAHPGAPEATRAAGMPAGLRQWRSGDSGRAIMPATLYSLLGRAPALPPTRPRVRLKSSSRATSVLVLLEGTGALLSPAPRDAPSKAAYAARLAAFLAGAVTLSRGRARVARVGSDEPLSEEAAELAEPILDALAAPPSYLPPVVSVETVGGGASLVYFVCDGLALSVDQVRALADAVIVEGNQLRVAAIISADDAHGTILHRDPRSGQFADDTEVVPQTFLEQRNLRLRAAQHELDRRGSQLVVLDSDLGTAETLQRLHEIGFLN